MTDIIIENIVKITAALLLMLIGVLGTYLTTLAAKRAETANVSEALRALTEAAKTTVGELQQTIVGPLKAAAADGKLTPDEIADLRNMLVAQTKQKMLPSAINIINAAGADIEAIILGVGENLINKAKQ
jgi:hypothetical protein|nr:MAG TPA_asm: hypothetical protein [Caudoviricetes sp.]